MPTAVLPAHLVGKIRRLGDLLFDETGSATYTALTAQQTAVLSLYGATVGGSVAQNPIPAGATPIYPSALVLVGVNTSVATTSAQIDAAVFPASANVAPTDGVIVQDATNKLLLTRQAGKWYKTGALTLIA